MSSAAIVVRLAYADPKRQWELSLEVAPGTTVSQLLRQVRDRSEVKQLDLDALGLGIWGECVSGDRVLAANDRLELYRPLRLDPKAARRLRAQVPRA
ncbi:MAG: RnfH family protein [Pseudomonadota bacterium]